MRVFLLLIACLGLAACTEAVPSAGKSRILVMGDSMLAAHQMSGRSVGHVLERELGEPVTDRSVYGARVIYALPVTGSLGMRIGSQYRPGPWDWVVLNGGGNDLWFGCGCGRCGPRLSRLITPDGERGQIPDIVRNLRQSGARVVYLGYLRSPGRGSPIEHCKNEADALEGRVALMAGRDKGVTFVSIADLVPHGDTSFHAPDMIHPSVKGAGAIAARVAKVIKDQR